jgi:very-short-patch-repair endonuclease
MAALALDTSSGGDAESPFEESVISAIRSWGYDVAPQVGAAGYRIDIGIRHPDYPGVYVLGIECDGFQYHSSKVARDRDRLREQVLRGLGWRLHRIWGTAWYRNRNGEEERLRDAIESAVAAPIRGLLGGLDVGDCIDRPAVVVEAATFAVEPDWAVPYEAAVVAPLARWIDPGDMGSRFEIAPAITNIATVEGPVHMSVVHERLRGAWNIGRVGARIRDNIDYAVIVAKVLREGDFIRLPNTVVETVRTPTDACARTVEQVHDDELALSLVNLVRDVGAIGQDDLTASVARVFGWTRRGQDISTRLLAVINGLLEMGALSGDAEALTVAREAPSR